MVDVSIVRFACCRWCAAYRSSVPQWLGVISIGAWCRGWRWLRYWLRGLLVGERRPLAGVPAATIMASCCTSIFTRGPVPAAKRTGRVGKARPFRGPRGTKSRLATPAMRVYINRSLTP